MSPHTSDLFNVAFTLFVLLIVIAGTISWIYEAVRHHRDRCHRVLNPPRTFDRDWCSAKRANIEELS